MVNGKDYVMALIICPECKKRISDTASSCPNCGYQLIPEKVAEIIDKSSEVRKKNRQGRKRTIMNFVILIFIFILVIVAIDDPDSSPNYSSKPKTRNEKIEEYFSAWDGSHRGLTKLIKKSMNDPDSYDHAETKYWDNGDYLIVKTTFRGKNAFGGVVINWVKAKVDLDGNVIGVIEQSQ